MLLSAFIVFTGMSVYSFPLMVKHGYTTCITCHFSPSGGGLLNSYGKFVAGELFGRYNTSEDALKWITAPEEDKFFNAGVLLRGAQSYFNTPTIKRGTFERMQADLEMVLSKGPYFAEMSAGLRGSSARAGQRDTDLKVRTYYVGARDYWYAIRVGRFFPEFGIRNPNHNVPTRKGLFWNQGDEPYLAQASLLSPTFDYTIGYLEGAKETQLADRKGYLYTVSYKTGHTRTGISNLEASNSNGKSQATSIFTNIGHNEQIYFHAEYAKKNVITYGDTSSSTNRVLATSDLTSMELGYEHTKGVFPYIGFDSTISTSVSHDDGASPDSRIYYLPLGVKFYPYTHFEFIAQFAPGRQVTATKSVGIESGFFMANIYF